VRTCVSASTTHSRKGDRHAKNKTRTTDRWTSTSHARRFPSGVGAPGIQGFDVISEGVVEPTTVSALNITLFGNAGYSFTGAFWASAGARARFTLDAFEIHASASAGTDGTQLQAGATTELFGFGAASDVTYTLGNTPVISLRGWGDIAGIGLTANATLAGTAVSLLVGGNMNLETYGLSANLGFTNGTFTTASVGANTSLGALSLSANGGWAAGQFTASGGAGLILGPAQITANAGYNYGIGINAVVSAGAGMAGISDDGRGHAGQHGDRIRVDSSVVSRGSSRLGGGPVRRRRPQSGGGR